MTTKINGLLRRQIPQMGHVVKRITIEMDEASHCTVKAEMRTHSLDFSREMDARELILILQKVAMDYTSFVLAAKDAEERKGVIHGSKENNDGSNVFG